MADSELAEVLLKLVADRESIDSYDVAKELDKDHQLVVGVIKSLQSLGNVIHTEICQFNQWELTKEGIDIAEKGSHEVRVFRAVDGNNGSLHSELMKSVPNAELGLNKAISAGWLKVSKEPDRGLIVTQVVSTVQDKIQAALKAISTDLESRSGSLIDEGEIEGLRKRKLIANKVIKSFIVTRGSEFSIEIAKLESELTAEMIQSGSWKEMKFKSYNFDALGMSPKRGHLHPLMKVRTEIRQIFLEMGFTEMPTNNFIESSFWNFDALFQPQQHPARDQHDTFFLKDPKLSYDFPMDYVERVKSMHEVGGHGSLGYQYEWKLEEAQKNILRTHTTAVSARMLYNLGKQESFTPVKYFSIDRVFRNEALDATHLAEFHQIEGLIADYNLSLADLMGVLNEFFSKMGIGKLRFKPAYNPYTEPSMEVFSYHEGLQKLYYSDRMPYMQIYPVYV